MKKRSQQNKILTFGDKNMTEEKGKYRPRLAGAGRKPSGKKRLFNKVQVQLSPEYYDKLIAHKEATGNTLQFICNAAIELYLDEYGMGEK